MADPGFPVGGHGPIRGRGPPMQALCTENVCKNEIIESHRGACARHAPLDPPMHTFFSVSKLLHGFVLEFVSKRTVCSRSMGISSFEKFLLDQGPSIL